MVMTVSERDELIAMIVQACTDDLFAVRRFAELRAFIATYAQNELGQLVSWSEGLSAMPDLARRDLGRAVTEASALLVGGLARRPKRLMPSLPRIARFHRLGEYPVCVRCKWCPPCGSWSEASGHLERAHIIDRIGDGLDAEWNLAPLCYECHRIHQPAFFAGDEVEALRWFGLDTSGIYYYQPEQETEKAQ